MPVAFLTCSLRFQETALRPVMLPQVFSENTKVVLYRISYVIQKNFKDVEQRDSSPTYLQIGYFYMVYCQYTKGKG